MHLAYLARVAGLPSIMGAKIGRPDMPVVGFAGDGAFGISMNEMSAIGRKEWPPITRSSSVTISGRGKAQHHFMVR